ncbi:helix-turn-helix domain-containing protein [Sphingomonas aracearum]|uniref:DUF4019 domain-containing protein n=1 Tax=Sphingomonas aracearum TaxID=2283317 RepID=A0A369VXC2_9SPHN|nr:DUF4019 domain-containing protein [Sphingomonas aracearum]RDE06783.1 DUF4019 domain-containing protein [Sphingomonas aracearum]
MITDALKRLDSLTEREKQTLRLIVRGHDAKSIARSLDLSVHTINERLREARRKVGVSSSREAARMLFEAEAAGTPPTPDPLVRNEIGEAMDGSGHQEEAAPDAGVGQPHRLSPILFGVALMALVAALLALAVLPQNAAAPAPAPVAEAPQTAVVDAARQWLNLLDQSRWDDSYRATGTVFRRLNSAAAWVAASRKVRVPLGAMMSRTLVSQENLPAPPDGYEVVKFRTRFANKEVAIETVTLLQEDGGWHVVGVTVG